MIIGGIMAIGVPRLFGEKKDNRQVFRSLVVNVKEIRNRAKLYGTTYRLAFRLDEGQQSYWVEKSNTVSLIDKKALEDARSAAKTAFRSDEEAKPVPAFAADTSFFKKEQTLPQNYSFVLVESGSQDASYSDGMAYIHFFPQGFIEPAVVQIKDPKNNIWTLVFNSITGQADIIDGAKTIKDLTR